MCKSYTNKKQSRWARQNIIKTRFCTGHTVIHFFLLIIILDVSNYTSIAFLLLSTFPMSLPTPPQCSCLLVFFSFLFFFLITLPSPRIWFLFNKISSSWSSFLSEIIYVHIICHVVKSKCLHKVIFLCVC